MNRRATPLLSRASLLAAGALLAAGSLLAAGAAQAEDLRGRVQLLAKGGKGPARGSDVRQAVVYFEPRTPAKPAAPAAPFQMVTEKKEFEPRVLAVPRGSRVRFPNMDPILHNVFSVSGENSFDLGLYRKGPGKEVAFDQSGVVRVFCNVHHDMVAYVLVLDTPFFTSPDANGEFRLTGLPRGRGRLTVWHEQIELWTVDVPLPQGGGSLNVRVEVSKPRLPAHLNKSGKAYQRRDRYGNH